MFAFVVVGSAVGLVYGALQSTDPAMAAFAGVTIALASAAVGGLIGLLFGLPKRVPPAVHAAPPAGAPAAASAAAAGATQLTYSGNTNLEEVSDWLTKILLGAGLTQLVRLPSALDHLGSYLAPSLGKGSAAVFATALVVLNLLAGFFYAFLGARILLPKVLTDAETKVALTKARVQQLKAVPTTTGIGERSYTTDRTTRQDALQLYRQMVSLERLTPGASFSSDDYRRVAQELVKVKRPVTAVNLLKLAMQYYDDDPRLPLSAGVIYGRELHQYDEAERSYYEALHLDPDFGVAYYDLACNYARRNHQASTSTTAAEQQKADFYLDQAKALLARVKSAYPGLWEQSEKDSVWDEVGLRDKLVKAHLVRPAPPPKDRTTTPPPSPTPPPPPSPLVGGSS